MSSFLSNNEVTRKYNLLIDRVHHTKLSISPLPKTVLPQIIDLRSRFPEPFDQGELGSCTANALCSVMSYDLSCSFIGSRLFVYYNERMLENDIGDDAGAQLSDGILTLQKYGVCSEKTWPYDISKFTLKPPNNAYIEAKQHVALKVSNISNDITSMKTSLANGFPFVVGIKVFDEFESDEVAKTGIVPLPTELSNCIGGHAVVCVGYNDIKKQWIMRNSWGNSWGDNGYFYLPYLYLLDSELASDLWNIQYVK